MWRGWASRVRHHGVWGLNGLGTVDDMGLHHTLIKTQGNFSTDSSPAAVITGECYPVCAVAAATLATPSLGCKSKVSAWRAPQGQGKARRIVQRGGKCETRAPSSSAALLRVNNWWEGFPKSPWDSSWPGWLKLFNQKWRQLFDTESWSWPLLRTLQQNCSVTHRLWEGPKWPKTALRK